MNSLASRELTGRNLKEQESGEELQVEWTLSECSATTQVSVPPPPFPSPPPPAPAPEAPVVVLAAPAPEEEVIQEVEVKDALASFPAVEEDIIGPAAFVPSPEVEEEIREQVTPVPSSEIEVVEELLSVPVPEEEPLSVASVEESVLMQVPAPELEENPEILLEPPQFEIIFTPPPAASSDLLAPAPEQEPVLIVNSDPVAVATTLPVEEEKIEQLPQQKQKQPALQGNIQEKQQSGVENDAVFGLPGDNVRTLPRVGNIGLAFPMDYQPFPAKAFVSIACGFASVSSHFQTHFAGMASFQGQNENACGNCLAVRCANPASCPSGTETVIQVVDTCGTCKENDLNLSSDALKDVMGEEGLGNFLDTRVTWRQVPCKSKTEGSMYLELLHGVTDNEYYGQMSLSNAAQEISTVRINGQSLIRMSGIGGGRWEWLNNGKKLNLSLPAVLEVTGMDGKVMEMELQKFESQELPSGGQI